jgi:hypothetical protein
VLTGRKKPSLTETTTAEDLMLHVINFFAISQRIFILPG